MIALPHHLPFVRVGSNTITPCQDQWLDQIIIDASAETNVPAWFATDISKGIQQYLQNSYEGSVIDSDELFMKISSTLHQIGLADVAARIDRTPPPLRISLTDLARRAGKAYELAFFQLLEDKCQEAIDCGASCVECHGLITCVEILCGPGQAPEEVPEDEKEVQNSSAKKSRQNSTSSGVWGNWPTRFLM